MQMLDYKLTAFIFFVCVVSVTGHLAVGAAH